MFVNPKTTKKATTTTILNKEAKSWSYKIFNIVRQFVHLSVVARYFR